MNFFINVNVIIIKGNFMSEITNNSTSNLGTSILQLITSMNANDTQSATEAAKNINVNASPSEISTSLADIIAKFYEGMRLAETSDGNGVEAVTSKETVKVKKKKKSFWGRIKSFFQKVTKTVTSFVQKIGSKLTSGMSKIKDLVDVFKESFTGINNIIDSAKNKLSLSGILGSVVPGADSQV